MTTQFTKADGTPSVTRVLEVPDTDIAAAIAAMSACRATGILTELRGGRRTELARPISGHARETIRSEFSILPSIAERVEDAISGSGLFLRTLKFDDARASSTQPDTSSILRGNLHFDAELWNKADYGGDVTQFYMNIGKEPREFRYLPVPLNDVLATVCDEGETVHTLEPKEALHRFMERFTPALTYIIVPHGHLAAFNGRKFAHDAGKGATREGAFVPSHEPDFVATLDVVEQEYGVGYDPRKSFFADIA